MRSVLANLLPAPGFSLTSSPTFTANVLKHNAVHPPAPALTGESGL